MQDPAVLIQDPLAISNPGRLRPRDGFSGPVGFTLIELLVVISIIALLIAILLPVLGQVRKSAHDTICASNARQVALGVVAYSNDAKDRTPAPMTSLPPFGVEKVLWQVEIWSYVYDGGGVDQGDRNIPHAYLADTIFECPRAEEQPGGYSTGNHIQNGYGLNNGLIGNAGRAGLGASPEARMADPKRIDLLDQPAGTLMIVDASSLQPKVEYYDRGARQNMMAAGEQGMISAKGRHGDQLENVRWNIAFFDASVRITNFEDVPGPPEKYYSTGSRLTPLQLLTNPDVERETRIYWTGQSG